MKKLEIVKDFWFNLDILIPLVQAMIIKRASEWFKREFYSRVGEIWCHLPYDDPVTWNKLRSKAYE